MVTQEQQNQKGAQANQKADKKAEHDAEHDTVAPENAAPAQAFTGEPEKPIDKEWRHVRSRLRAELGEATFDSWFKSLDVVACDNGKVTLEVPTRFVGSWIESHYVSRILDHWKIENPAIRQIVIEVCRTPKATKTTAPRSVSGRRTTMPRYAASAETKAREDMGAPLDAHYTFDNFVIGKSNELAYSAARRMTDAVASGEEVFNPLFLYGGVGLGKTHLMHAIAWEIRRSAPERRVLYLSAEKFMHQFIHALRHKDTMAFKQQFREVDVLMVDDIQFIAGKESTQEEFFHTFNTLIDKKHQVIVSADRSPADLDGIEERISSRLGGGLVADIHPTDYELRLGILQSKATRLALANKNITIPAEVLEFLAQRIASNIRVLEGALHKIVAFASFSNNPITLEMAKDVLRDLLRSSERRVTIDEIQRKVAEYYSVRMGDMLSPRRSRAVARPRQIAMYISKHLTTRSLPEIGRQFGGRDHTTVIHAVRRVEELRQADPSLDEDVDLLVRSLEA